MDKVYLNRVIKTIDLQNRIDTTNMIEVWDEEGWNSVVSTCDRCHKTDSVEMLLDNSKPLQHGKIKCSTPNCDAEYYGRVIIVNVN